MRRRVILYILFVFFMLAIVSIPVGMFLLPKGKAVYYLALSLNMIKEGNTEGAIEQAKKAVELRPESIVALRGLAKAYASDGRYDDEAMEAVEQFVLIAPQLAEAHYYMGVLKLNRLDIEGAREAAQKAISLSPDFPENYQLLGAIALEEKDLEAAEKHLARGVELDSDNPMTNYLLGSIHFEKGDYYQAIERFQKVTLLLPNYARAHAMLAMCYFSEKLYIHALSELNKAVDLDPSDTNSMYNIACVYSLQNKPEPALNWLERAIDKGFSDFEHMLKDTDLDNIRNMAKYKELIENTGLHVESRNVHPDNMSEATKE